MGVGSVSSVSAVQSVSVSRNTTAMHRQPEVKFGTLVLHRVSVYITWPREPGCSVGNATDVVGYRLRYQAIDNANEFIARQLTDNFVLLESVQSNVRYRFQVKYVFADGSETDWSGDGLIDTTPVQRQTLANWTHVLAVMGRLKMQDKNGGPKRWKTETAGTPRNAANLLRYMQRAVTKGDNCSACNTAEYRTVIYFDATFKMFSDIYYQLLTVFHCRHLVLYFLVLRFQRPRCNLSTELGHCAICVFSVLNSPEDVSTAASSRPSVFGRRWRIRIFTNFICFKF